MIESFFGIPKAKYHHLATLDGLETLEAGVNDYIRYYNHERIKLGLQRLSPVKNRLKTPPDWRERDRPTSGGQFKPGVVQFQIWLVNR